MAPYRMLLFMTKPMVVNCMRTNKDIKIKPVDKNTWNDFENLFKSKGGPSYCWCMPWRMSKDELKQNSSPNRYKFIKQRVWSGIPIGLLAYVDQEPVAWCSVAPRDTHYRLGGEIGMGNVWSITCFFIKREFRDKGLIDQLINYAEKYARENGAEYIEAYPVLPDSPSYRHMGFVRTFEKAGYEFRKMAGSRRHVMIKNKGYLENSG